MKIACIGGHWHSVSPTGLIVIIAAFMDGDLQHVGRNGIVPLCLKEAFTPERMAEYEKKYRNTRPYLKNADEPKEDEQWDSESSSKSHIPSMRIPPERESVFPIVE